MIEHKYYMYLKNKMNLIKHSVKLVESYNYKQYPGTQLL